MHESLLPIAYPLELGRYVNTCRARSTRSRFFSTTVFDLPFCLMILYSNAHGGVPNTPWYEPYFYYTHTLLKIHTLEISGKSHADLSITSTFRRNRSCIKTNGWQWWLNDLTCGWEENITTTKLIRDTQ